MVKLDVLVAGDPADALSLIVHRDYAYDRGKEPSAAAQAHPRQMHEVSSRRPSEPRRRPREYPCQRRTCSPNAGGDITCSKLLEAEEGKRRMKRVGKVDIPGRFFPSPSRRRGAAIRAARLLQPVTYRASHVHVGGKGWTNTHETYACH
jgi:GTP-binding protein LepA